MPLSFAHETVLRSQLAPGYNVLMLHGDEHKHTPHTLFFFEIFNKKVSLT